MKKKPKQTESPALTQMLVFEYRGQLVADSRDVAPFVEKGHAHLLRDIRRYIKVIDKSENPKLDSRSYFIEATYTSEQGKCLPCYYCTEMGCEVIAHKMTGDRGIIFTARYVKAFHAMRVALSERQSPQRQQARAEGKATRRLETDAVKAFAAYATTNGSKNAQRYFTNFTKLANKAIGIEAGQRDKVSTAQLLNLRMVEQVIEHAILVELAAETEYHAAFRNVKAKVQQFAELALVPRTVLPQAPAPPVGQQTRPGA